MIVATRNSLPDGEPRLPNRLRNTLVTYAIVSYENRRDLQDPLRFFERLQPIHFFRHAPYGDVAHNEQERIIQYHNPYDLLQKLRKARPQIVQGGEPMVPRLVPYAWAELTYTRFARRPLVIPTFDNIPIADQYGAAMAVALRTAARPYVRAATLIIPANDGAEKNVRSAGARPDQLVRMMYGTWGVDTSEFTPDGPRAKLPGTGPAIVFLGRLIRYKGVFDLVAAMPKVLERVSADLVFIGDGPDAGGLKQAARDAGVADRVHFIGVVENKDVPSYLRAASVLGAPSRTTRRWAEQVGMSAMQALACGVPVVTNASGSIPEFIEHGVTGLVVQEGIPEALADAITRLLTNDVMHHEFATRARQEAVRRYDARANIHAAEDRILAATGFSR
jgi:glycosyltransferase involved in cell wall biosynthesis